SFFAPTPKSSDCEPPAKISPPAPHQCACSPNLAVFPSSVCSSTSAHSSACSPEPSPASPQQPAFSSSCPTTDSRTPRFAKLTCATKLPDSLSSSPEPPPSSP